MPRCTHKERIQRVEPSGEGCKECLELGASWVHLRICLECGHVGCCDASPNRHARAHWHAEGHPLIQSFEPGEDWGWCFEDDVALRVPADAGPGRSHA